MPSQRQPLSWTFPDLLRSDLVKWNKTWDLQLSLFYAYRLGDSSHVSIAWLDEHTRAADVDDPTSDPQKSRSLQTDTAVHIASEQKTELCLLQRDLSQKYSVKCALHDFETSWTGKSAGERSAHMLRGFKNTFSAHEEIELCRIWCPDVTLARMNRDNGGGFLELLRGLLLEDIDSVPNHFKTFGDAVWDLPRNNSATLVSNRARQVAKMSFTLQRTLLITWFAWSTLLDFYGESEPHVVVKSGKLSRKERKTYNESAPYFDPSDLTTTVPAFAKPLIVNICTTCRQGHKPGGKSLSTCAKCKAIGRYVYYCGKECQAKDWKEGTPPHKTICGNQEAYLDSLLNPVSRSEAWEPAETTAAVVWPPKPGYMRSPALLHQIQLLTDAPSINYYIIPPASVPWTQGLQIEDQRASASFNFMRKYAMCCGSPWAVRKLFDGLSGQLVASDFEERIVWLKSQLKREYDVDVDCVDLESHPSRQLFVDDIRSLSTSIDDDTLRNMMEDPVFSPA